MSPVKQVQVAGQTLKLGRNRAVAKGPRLRLSNYLLKSLPPPPAAVDYSGGPAAAALQQMYLNDQLGDCVIACMAHVVGVLTGNANPPAYLYTQQDIIALYSAIGGYVPGNPSTDQGCNEQTALDYWLNNGAPKDSHKIVGYLAVNPQDTNEYRTALWLFENLVFGLELPDSYLNITGSGFTWGPGTPNPNNGHCVSGVGYDSSISGVKISTWGMTGTFLDTALHQILTPNNAGELWVVLSQDLISKATQKASNGFDWSQLQADFQAIGGGVTPPPPPPPTPPPAPLQQQIDAIFAQIEAKLQHRPGLLKIVKEIQAQVDAVLQAWGPQRTASAIFDPNQLVAIVDSIFKAIEGAIPAGLFNEIEVAALRWVNQLVDKYITTGSF